MRPSSVMPARSDADRNGRICRTAPATSHAGIRAETAIVRAGRDRRLQLPTWILATPRSRKGNSSSNRNGTSASSRASDDERSFDASRGVGDQIRNNWPALTAGDATRHRAQALQRRQDASRASTVSKISRGADEGVHGAAPIVRPVKAAIVVPTSSKPRCQRIMVAPVKRPLYSMDEQLPRAILLAWTLSGPRHPQRRTPRRTARQSRAPRVPDRP